MLKFRKFQNFHWWFKIFKNRNWPIYLCCLFRNIFRGPLGDFWEEKKLLLGMISLFLAETLIILAQKIVVFFILDSTKLPQQEVCWPIWNWKMEHSSINIKIRHQENNFLDNPKKIENFQGPLWGWWGRWCWCWGQWPSLAHIMYVGLPLHPPGKVIFSLVGAIWALAAVAKMGACR